ncbi:MAG TPA: SDR family oxidoreductase [Alphaproteobacteria bacterium]|nr:SDR family oxidoreductase [Alphaproteobacteria bacterium]
MPESPDSSSDIIAVTGASRGLGAAIALELAGRGLTVGCLSRQGIGPAETVAVPDELAARMVMAKCDINDGDSIRASLAALSDQGYRLRHFIANAGTHIAGPSHKFADADMATLLDTNVAGTFSCLREAYQYLGEGSVIVTIGSFYDRIGAPQNAIYAASKAAIGAIARTLAVEWARDGIRVINIAPGYIETDLNKEFLESDRVREFFKCRVALQRWAQPDEIARLIAALLQDDHPLLSGETIYLDGGHAITHGRI